MSTRFAGLCAALALTTFAAAQDSILMPAQPVSPTRTEQMAMAATGFVVDGVPVTAVGPGCVAACPAPAARRRIFDGTCLNALQAVLYRSRVGVATPLSCSCLASERNFMFGGCRAFFMPGLECTSCGLFGGGCFGPIEYGRGHRGTAPDCPTGYTTGLPLSR